MPSNQIIVFILLLIILTIVIMAYEPVSDCLDIPDTAQQNNCLTNLAIASTDHSICEQTTQTELCYARYTAEVADSIQTCNLSEKTRLTCLISLAIKQNNVSICNVHASTDIIQGRNYTAAELCIFRFVQETKDTTLCTRTGNLSGQCYG